MPAVLPKLVSHIAAAADTWQRLLAVGIIWGGLAFAWGTIAEQALTGRLPPVQGHVARAAAEAAEYLTQSADVLLPLVADPRLAAGLASEDGMDSREVRRAMYEFSYLNRLGKLWVYNTRTGAINGVPGSGDIPPPVLEWLQKSPPNADGRAMAYFTEESYLQPEYYVTRAIPGSQGAAVIVRLSFQNLLAGWPRPVEVPGYPAAQQGILGMGGNPGWWLPFARPENAASQAWFSGGKADYQRGVQGSIWVWHPIPGHAGWYMATSFSYAGALGEGRAIQYGLFALAFALTLWILWHPTAPARRRVAQATKPIVMPVYRLLAPSLEQVSNIIRQESAPAQSLAVPGGHQKEDFALPKRLRMLNLGSLTANKKNKPDLAPAPQEQASPIKPLDTPDLDTAAAAAEKNDGAPKEPQSNLAEVLDRALKQRRIQLLYQPIFNVGSGESQMHEVLARLGDDEGHWILPETFIPELARHNWLPRLDALVFLSVVAKYDNPDEDMPRLCINVSGSSVESLRYLDVLTGPEKQPISDHLVFEVSSQELLTNPNVIKKLMEIKQTGVQLAVDYFGGGQKMLEGAAKLGFDFIKLNAMKFSQSDGDKKALISLCHTAKRLDLPVVLEKIETVPMEVFARKAAIPYLQGYQLARPTPTLRKGNLQSWQVTSSEHKDPQKEVEASASEEAPAAPSAADSSAEPPPAPTA